MVGTSPGDVTRLLVQLQKGNPDAESELVVLVYGELRRLAAYYMRLERRGHTLQTSDLVHEAYLRLVGQDNVSWQNRSHFFGVAAQIMRRILVDHARKHLAKKRGGSRDRISLDVALLVAKTPSSQILALDEALSRLAERDARLGRVVELRFFGGLSEAEAAEVLGISTRTVKRDWGVARAWLYQELNP
jgi:RNA polymerase sigma-70 factor (ECF subfamily)